MSMDSHYDHALQAALAVLHTLASQPDMPRQEQLAKATYIILDAIKQAETGRVACDDGTDGNATGGAALPKRSNSSGFTLSLCFNR